MATAIDPRLGQYQRTHSLSQHHHHQPHHHPQLPPLPHPRLHQLPPLQPPQLQHSPPYHTIPPVQTRSLDSPSHPFFAHHSTHSAHRQPTHSVDTPTDPLHDNEHLSPDDLNSPQDASLPDDSGHPYGSALPPSLRP
jgi:hypothetical protein